MPWKRVKQSSGVLRRTICCPWEASACQHWGCTGTVLRSADSAHHEAFVQGTSQLNTDKIQKLCNTDMIWAGLYLLRSFHWSLGYVFSCRRGLRGLSPTCFKKTRVNSLCDSSARFSLVLSSAAPGCVLQVWIFLLDKAWKLQLGYKTTVSILRFRERSGHYKLYSATAPGSKAGRHATQPQESSSPCQDRMALGLISTLAMQQLTAAEVALKRL